MKVLTPSRMKKKVSPCLVPAEDPEGGATPPPARRGTKWAGGGGKGDTEQLVPMDEESGAATHAKDRAAEAAKAATLRYREKLATCGVNVRVPSYLLGLLFMSQILTFGALVVVLPDFKARSGQGQEAAFVAEPIRADGPVVVGHHVVDLHQVPDYVCSSEARLKEIVESIITSLTRSSDMTAPGAVSSTNTHPDAAAISVFGALPQGGHVAVHAWPEHGYVALDHFGPGPAVWTPDQLAILCKHFGRDVDSQDHMSWSYARRGVDSRGAPLKQHDLDRYVLVDSTTKAKTLVHHKKSDFQDIQVWEFDDSWYFNTARGNRCLFLDGTIQSCLSDEHVYHESLVHPVMIAHPNPARVAIVGGGEGATLREVLRHKTVKSAVMVEIDNEVVEAAKLHLPTMPAASWSDERAKLELQGGQQYFEGLYGTDANPIECDAKAGQPECFDVIIVDVLDPQNVPEMLKGVFSAGFLRTISRALSDDGVLVWQIGEASVADGIDADAIQTLRFVEMAASEFEHVTVYSQSVPSFQNSWSFMVGFGRHEEYSRWNRNTAAINLDLNTRLNLKPDKDLIISSMERDGLGRLEFQQPLWKDRSPSMQRRTQLHHFDGATMHGYQQTPSGYQFHYCSLWWIDNSSLPDATWTNCRYLAKESVDFGVAEDEEFIEIMDSTHIASGRGLFTTQDIPYDQPEGTLFGSFDAATSMTVPREMYLRLEKFAKQHEADGPLYKSLLDWIDRFGYYCDNGGGEYYISIDSKNTFTNHNCNPKEASMHGPFDPLEAQYDEQPLYADLNIVEQRYGRNICVEQYTKHDIKKGEEIMDNFLGYYDPQVQANRLRDVRSWCGSNPTGPESASDSES